MATSVPPSAATGIATGSIRLSDIANALQQTNSAQARLEETRACFATRAQALQQRPTIEDDIELFWDPAPEPNCHTCGKAQDCAPINPTMLAAMEKRAMENMYAFLRDIETIEPETRLMILYQHLREAGYQVSFAADDVYVKLIMKDIPQNKAHQAMTAYEAISDAFARVYGVARGHVLHASFTRTEDNNALSIELTFLPLQ